MARTLPWTAQGASSSSKVPSKRVSAAVPKDEPRDDISRPVTPEPTPRMSRKRSSARSPSTSPIQPPAQPIPQISPMRDGLHQDDRYIMVEDEFEFVARQYTAHLHAAEYARLKRKAKGAPPKALPDLSPSKSRTTNMNLERKHLLSRQSTMMSDLGKRAAAAGSDRGASEEEDDEAEQKVDDLWLGTSLAGLMDEGNHVKTSLVGMEKLNSKTRAAKGFGRGETESTPVKKKKTIKDIFAEVNGRDGGAEQLFDTHTSRHRDRTNDHGNDDDENDNRKSKIHTNYAGKSDKPTERKLTFDDKLPQPHPQTQNNNPKSARKKLVFADDFDESQFPTNTSAGVSDDVLDPPRRAKLLPSPSPSPISSKRKADVRKGRKARLDEVPVFLA